MKQAETVKKLWNRWKYAVLVAAAGVALLLLPSGNEKSADTVPEERIQDAVQETQANMEKILMKIDGVGELHLMLTADTGTERSLAQDTDLSYSGDTAAPTDYQRKSETVLAGKSGAQEPVVTGTRCPTFRGALVVCQGAGDAQVRLAVTAAVAALTGLGSDRITVVKCQ